MFAEWLSQYRVRITLIDEQHQELFAALNRLHDEVLCGADSEVLKVRLSQFIGLVQKHFADEERMLKETGYPGYEKQRTDHAALIKQLKDKLLRVNSGEIEVSTNLLGGIRDQLTLHISGPDAAYAEFLADCGMR